MKIITIAAKLRKDAVDMEIMAAMDGDLDFPDELVLPFIINAVTDKRMLRGASRGGIPMKVLDPEGRVFLFGRATCPYQKVRKH